MVLVLGGPDGLGPGGPDFGPRGPGDFGPGGPGDFGPGGLADLATLDHGQGPVSDIPGTFQPPGSFRLLELFSNPSLYSRLKWFCSYYDCDNSTSDGSQTGGFNQAGEGPGGFRGGRSAFSADDIGPEGGPDGPGGPADQEAKCSAVVLEVQVICSRWLWRTRWFWRWWF